MNHVMRMKQHDVRRYRLVAANTAARGQNGGNGRRNGRMINYKMALLAAVLLKINN